MSAGMRVTLTALIASASLGAIAIAYASNQGDPKSGERIARTWCASCHTVAPDQAVASPDVPTFASLAQRPDVTPDGLSVFLVNPHPPMPDMNLSTNEIADVTAYIMSLRKD